MSATRMNIAVRRATPVDARRLLPVLVHAYLSGPVADWLIPNITERRVVYYRYFRLMLTHGLRYGRVDTTDDLSAVAIWYRRDETPAPVVPTYREQLGQAAGKYAPKFVLLDTMFEAHHPRVPHDYLAFLAVDPERQGRGVGSALLNRAHARLDAEHRAAYLEASNERNRDLYLRLGYRTGAPMMLPTAGPPIWRMWRGQREGDVGVAFPPATMPRRRSL
ncbi:GNAT family N-acetyltransferase [Micromonospora azadirachtae]|uniref:GNAT family N-acetyltransferase n=1 Tax=Micromonospora azadirachtae TaxID=1970735 RepID=A0ABW2ZXJ2_9ACTN